MSDESPTFSPSASAFPSFAGTGSLAPSASPFPTASPTASIAPSASAEPTWAATMSETDSMEPSASPFPTASPTASVAPTFADTMSETDSFIPTPSPEGAFPARTEAPSSEQVSPSTGGGNDAAKNFGWVTFAGVFLVAIFFVWRGYAYCRRRRDQKMMDNRSAQADRVLGDMQMIPNQEMDLL